MKNHVSFEAIGNIIEFQKSELEKQYPANQANEIMVDASMILISLVTIIGAPINKSTMPEAFRAVANIVELMQVEKSRASSEKIANKDYN